MTDREEVELAAGEGPDETLDEGSAPEEAGLERRLERLEAIVAALEADDLELDRALALFEEGITHVRRAEAILATTELRVEELLGDGDEARTRDFDAGSA
jgi:exodeoxyribonuclease VII small subunit